MFFKLANGMKNLRALTMQRRSAWFAVLFCMMRFMATVWFNCWQGMIPSNQSGQNINEER